MIAKDIFNELATLSNIKIGGRRPQDIVVHDERVYRRVLRDGGLGLGESYMDGWWDARKLDEFFNHLFAADIESKLKPGPKHVIAAVDAKLRNQQSASRAKRNAEHHYNIGNDLYQRMLDPHMAYTCAYWKRTKSLKKAQEQKFELVCQKLGLKKGMRVLDLGCGWGGFLTYAAKHYGIQGVGITPAAEQVAIARKRTRGLDVEIRQQDYREATGTFDRVVSIGILEHIGTKNYRTFFDVCNRVLAPGGMMLHHTIGGNNDQRRRDPFMNKYIFPGGVIPSLSQISRAVEDKFVIEDVHNIGPDYDKTLMAWHKNFIDHYDEIKDVYDERFKRMWEYYLLICAAAFRQRQLQLWQIVMRRVEESDTYNGIR